MKQPSVQLKVLFVVLGVDVHNPVSYTHLDVYKRQELMRDSCMNTRDLAIIDLLASSGMRVGEMVMPVSYTHLEDFTKDYIVVFE